jgi:hypothetical protein
MCVRLVVVLSVMILGGCSSFNEKWEEAMSRPIPADDITGPWEGRWQSRKGHGGGRLRALIERAPVAEESDGGEPTPYVAHFRATWWGIFKSSYSVRLAHDRAAAGNVFAGRRDLGWFAGGLYTYGAEITPAAFEASYQSERGDSGIFQLERPE